RNEAQERESYSPPQPIRTGRANVTDGTVRRCLERPITPARLQTSRNILMCSKKPYFRSRHLSAFTLLGFALCSVFVLAASALRLQRRIRRPPKRPRPTILKNT